MTKLREGLPPLPRRLLHLPLDHRGYPIPWFVATLADGTRDFRVADGAKRLRAVNEKLCWLCGEPLGKFKCFVIGPMCVVNRNTSEPPSHRECAAYAVIACPFMTRPQAKYRMANLPSEDNKLSLPPQMLDGNPGGAAIWITESFSPYQVPGTRNEWLIRLGDPIEVSWWVEGKLATREQVLACFSERLPLLEAIAHEHGEDEVLKVAVARAMKYLPEATMTT
jgi:hypothetical protein